MSEKGSDYNQRGSLIKAILTEAQTNPYLDHAGAVEICSELLTNGMASIVRVISRGLLLLYRDQAGLDLVRSEVDSLGPFCEPLG